MHARQKRWPRRRGVTAQRRPNQRAFTRLLVERLEPRLPLALGPCAAPTCVEVELLPLFDEFGPQIETIQVYHDGVDAVHAAFAIYDTGASVITYSAAEQLVAEFLGSPIPIKVDDGAEADAVGGKLTGDVSQPGTIIADGLHAVSISSNLDIEIDLAQAAQAPGVQAFIGDASGSPILPTITGTPINNPSPTHPDGNAALIDMTAYQLDFGQLFPEFPEFAGIVVDLPDLRFTPPGRQLIAAADGSTTAPLRVPLTMWGEDNHLNPGERITTSPNPVQTEIDFFHGAADVQNKTMLFDTGAQLTVISTDIALGLGLDLNNPQSTITVQGAAGQADIPGFTIDAIEFPRDDNGDGALDGVLRFRNVPIYVLDIVPGLDGLIGTNLFNTASELLYDPFDPLGPSLSVTFFTDLVRELPTAEELAAIELLGGAFPALAGGISAGEVRFPIPSAGGWQNALSRLDVNADGFIAPDDALAVVNDLVINGARTLPYGRLRQFGAELFYIDINGDGAAAPDDALEVINYLVLVGAGPAPAPSPSLGAVSALIGRDALHTDANSSSADRSGAIFVAPPVQQPMHIRADIPRNGRAADEAFAAAAPPAYDMSPLYDPRVDRRGARFWTSHQRSSGSKFDESTTDHWDELLQSLADALAPRNGRAGARPSGVQLD